MCILVMAKIIPDLFIPADKYILKVLSRVNFDIGAKMANFLATGNLVSPTGLDLQQASGFTIVAEKLNWQRYISHFRSIHRGAFFAELKTTTVRKLLPEAWGTHSTQNHFRKCYLTSFLFDRLPVSCAYARWFSLWSSQPLVTNMPYRHYASCSKARSCSPSCSRHDELVCACYRRTDELMCAARRACHRLGKT